MGKRRVWPVNLKRDEIEHLRACMNCISQGCWPDLDEKLIAALDRLNNPRHARKKQICKVCRRNMRSPLFDGCMNEDCPHGHKPCL